MINCIDNRILTQAANIFGAEEESERSWPLHKSARRTQRILLAEDDEEMRSVLAESFGRAGYDVVLAQDGYRLMDHIAACLITGDEIDVDLVVSDVRMPGVDGLRALSALRSHDRTLPVILITAFGNAETHAEARLRGARAVLDKPFPFETLLALVRQNIRPMDRAPERNDPNGFNAPI